MKKKEKSTHQIPGSHNTITVQYPVEGLSFQSWTASWATAPVPISAVQLLGKRGIFLSPLAGFCYASQGNSIQMMQHTELHIKCISLVISQPPQFVLLLVFQKCMVVLFHTRAMGPCCFSFEAVKPIHPPIFGMLPMSNWHSILISDQLPTKKRDIMASVTFPVVNKISVESIQVNCSAPENYKSVLENYYECTTGL